MCRSGAQHALQPTEPRFEYFQGSTLARGLGTRLCLLSEASLAIHSCDVLASNSVVKAAVSPGLLSGQHLTSLIAALSHHLLQFDNVWLCVSGPQMPDRAQTS